MAHTQHYPPTSSDGVPMSEGHQQGFTSETETVQQAERTSSTDGAANEPRRPPSKHKPQLGEHFYWDSPALLIGTFLVGTAFAVGHHEYYKYLDGTAVGSSNRQQWALRFGNAFAFLTKVCLCASAQTTFIQWLWRSLKRKYVTVKGIDAAFSDTSTLTSFATWDMVSSMKMVSLLALVTWCIPFVALITPATLSVRLDRKQASVPAQVLTLEIPQSLYWSNDDLSENETVESQLNQWATFTPVLQQGSDIKYRSLGPADSLTKIISATVSTGQVFPVAQPFPGIDTTYIIDFLAPSIKCKPASEEVARNTTIAAIHSLGYSTVTNGNPTLNGSSVWAYNMSGINFDDLTYYFDNPQLSPDGEYLGARPTAYETIGYYAMVPFNGSTDDNAQSALYSSRQFQDLGLMEGNRNQIWIVLADQDPKTNAAIPRHITCTLWNLSLTLSVANVNGTQTLRTLEVKHLHVVDQPLQDWHSGDPSLNVNSAIYTAYVQGVANPLLGYIGRSEELEGGTSMPMFRKTASIFETIFTGSNELDAALRNLDVTPSYPTVSPISWNRSLSDMIEEFALNVSLNVMGSDSFSSMTTAIVNRTDNLNVYTYEPRNLFIAYGIAISISLIVLLLGLFAYWSNGVSYSSDISTIIRTTQNPEVIVTTTKQPPSLQLLFILFFVIIMLIFHRIQLRAIFGPHSLGDQPLPPSIANTKLKFGILEPDAHEHDSETGSPSGTSVGQGGESGVSDSSPASSPAQYGFGMQGSVKSFGPPHDMED